MGNELQQSLKYRPQDINEVDASAEEFGKAAALAENATISSLRSHWLETRQQCESLVQELDSLRQSHEALKREHQSLRVKFEGCCAQNQHLSESLRNLKADTCTSNVGASGTSLQSPHVVAQAVKQEPTPLRAARQDVASDEQKILQAHTALLCEHEELKQTLAHERSEAADQRRLYEVMQTEHRLISSELKRAHRMISTSPDARIRNAVQTIVEPQDLVSREWPSMQDWSSEIDVDQYAALQRRYEHLLRENSDLRHHGQDQSIFQKACSSCAVEWVP